MSGINGMNPLFCAFGADAADVKQLHSYRLRQVFADFVNYCGQYPERTAALKKRPHHNIRYSVAGATVHGMSGLQHQTFSALHGTPTKRHCAPNTTICQQESTPPKIISNFPSPPPIL